MDARTAGVKGKCEEEGLREKATAQGTEEEAPDLRGTNEPLSQWELGSVCDVETGKDKES